MTPIAVVLFLLFGCIGHVNSDNDSLHRQPKHTSKHDCTHHRYHEKAIKSSVGIAHRKIASYPTTAHISTQNRLAIMLLYSHGFTEQGNERQVKSRLDNLECALQKIKHNIMPQTTTDVYIWVLNTTTIIPIIPQWLNSHNLPQFHIMTISPESWKVPCDLKDYTEWATHNQFGIDYYLMGHWRLTFCMDFLRAMEYKYFLQLDDDSLIHSHFDFDIIKEFSTREVWIGSSSIYVEETDVSTGLAELTSYWLEITKYEVEGPLLHYCDPKNISGLTTSRWNKMNMQGNFIVISIDFWFREIVQDYVITVLRSGRHIEGRWNELGPQSMVWQLFVPSRHFFLFGSCGVNYDHWGLTKKDPQYLQFCGINNHTLDTISNFTCEVGYDSYY